MYGEDKHSEKNAVNSKSPEPEVFGDYFLVKAEENGVAIIGLTRGKETRFHHNEKLDKGEVMIFQFTAHTSAMKVRGKAKIYSRYGVVDVGE